MTKVMVFGTFDILHPGHTFFLKKAKRLGDFLIAIVSRDATVKKLKGKPPFFSERRRLKRLRRLNIADRVRLGRRRDKFEVIREERPEVIALGYDQTFFVAELKKRLGKKIRIIRLESFKPEQFKSSKLAKLYAKERQKNPVRHH